jgi:chemotaxis protein MotA
MAERTAKAPKAGSKPDLASFCGLALGLAGLIGGLLLEGGELKDISQATAALIVLGGTFGAVLTSTPLSVFLGAMRQLRLVFFEQPESQAAVIEQLIGYAQKARKNGLVSLEEEAQRIDDPFLRKALNLAVDGTDLQELRKMLELEMSIEEHHRESEARVWESAGGYAPTVGIIGAVMGLIQVMKNLGGDMAQLGHGIAVAFVATVYGVGCANLFFLPAANKIKARAHRSLQKKELILEGVSAIIEGLNPKLIRSKLEAFVNQSPSAVAKQSGTAREQRSRVLEAEG